MKFIKYTLIPILLILFCNAQIRAQYLFGDLGGVFNVNESGAATYTIQFEVPAGINGLQPNVGLIYNSQAGNGVAGMGFSIFGGSVITLCAKDYYHDKESKGLSWENKYYALDGARLIETSNNNYVLENSPYTIIEKSNNGFLVKYTNGTTFYYSSIDSRYNSNNHTWYITKIEDSYGNEINFSYDDQSYNQGCIYLKQIDYGNYDENTKKYTNSIKFEYASRTDVVKESAWNYLISMKSRLSRVVITTRDGNEEEKYSYEIEYLNNTRSKKAGVFDFSGIITAFNENKKKDKYSRIASITKKINDQTLPPVRFEWKTFPTFYTDINITQIPVDKKMINQDEGKTKFNHAGFFPCDINGDGYTDIASIFSPVSENTNGGKGKIAYFVNQGNGTFKTGSQLDAGYQTNETERTWGIKWLEHVTAYRQSQQLFGDFDGDMKDEIIIPNYVSEVKGKRKNKYVVNTLTLNYYGKLFEYYVGEDDFPAYSIGSILNNGKAQFLMIETGRDGNAGYIVRMLADDNNGSLTSVEKHLDMSHAPKRIFLADVNSNGVQDLIVIHDNGYTIFMNEGTKFDGKNAKNIIPYSSANKKNYAKVATLCNYSFMQPGDYNGDGAIDFLCNKGGKEWYICDGNGDGTFTKREVYGIPDWVHDQDFTDKDNDKLSAIVMDFNCDGYQDLIITKTDYDRKKDLWYVYGRPNLTYTIWLVSDGRNFSVAKQATSKRDEDGLAARYIQGDFDGDGYPDFINYGYDCYNGDEADVEPTLHLYKLGAITSNTNKIVKISSEQNGQTIDIEYSTLHDQDIYVPGSNGKYPIADVKSAINVVKKYTQSYADQNETYSYKYHELRMDVLNLKSLGFKKLEKKCDQLSESVTISVDGYDETYLLPTSVTTTKYGGSGTTIVAETRATTGIYQNDKKFPYFIYTSKTDSKDRYNNIVTNTNEYDFTKGVITKQRTEYDSGKLYTQTVYSNYQKYGNTYQPELATTTKKHSDDANEYISKTKITYYPNGAIESKIDFYGEANPITTTYEYDSYGNVKTETCSAEGMPTIASSYTYDQTHRFTKRVSSNLDSLITEYDYDIWGRVITKRSGLSNSLLSTTYEYDGAGNNTKTVFPDNTEQLTERNWGTSGLKYYKTTVSTTGSPTVETWYDNAGRDVSTSSVLEKELRVSSTKKYDNHGNVIQLTTTKGGIMNTITNTYTPYQELSSSKNSDTGEETIYTYKNREVKISHNGQVKTTKYDGWGNIKEITDNNITSKYKYNSDGSVAEITTDGSSYKFEYDTKGNQTKLIDPDAGTYEYEYDTYGKTTKKTDPRGNITNYEYSESGLLVKSICGGDVTEYEYTEKNMLRKESNNNQQVEYEYDELGRTTQILYTIDGRSYQYNYAYNDKGQTQSRTYPGNVVISKEYDAAGFTSKIIVNGMLVWSLDRYSGSERVSALANAIVLSKAYTKSGTLKKAQISDANAVVLHSFEYKFDGRNGNLEYRKGMMENTKEKFTYDKCDRLTEYYDVDKKKQNVTYKNNGNINSKDEFGPYSYEASNKPHAVRKIANVPESTMGTRQDKRYTPFNKIEYLTQDGYELEIKYGSDEQRCKSILKRNEAVEYVRYYLPGMDEIVANNDTYRYYYINSPDGLVAIVSVKNDETPVVYTVETDHLGSICKLYDANGTIQFDAYYDAWGNQSVTINNLEYFSRGYTGHEHWNQFGLIDMNGRMYDPIVGRFLSPDPYVQAPENPQNYNRYAYCLNNPLKYTDPSGEKWWHWVLGIGEVLTGGLVYNTAFTIASSIASATASAVYIQAYTESLTNSLSSGYGVQQLFSPIAIKCNWGEGSIQNGIGFDISLGVPKCTGFGYRFNWGKSLYLNNYCDFSGIETRKGGEWDILGVFSYSGTTFDSGETSQTTNKFTFGGWSYENDCKHFHMPWVPQCEESEDRYRTAAVRYQFGPSSLGLNMCTGNKSAQFLDDDEIYYEAGTTDDGIVYDPDKYRAGVLYIGIGPFRIGRNSEEIRDFFQNRLHKLIGDHLFKKLDNDPEWYWFFGSGSGNTLW